MKQEIKINGVGYFDSFFSAVDISTMANSLKKFVLEEHITEDSKPGEILNQFIGTIIRQIDLDEFKKLSPHLFTYPVHYEDILEVEQIPSSYNQLHYLQENIDSQLQIKPMTTQRREEKSMTSIENLKNLSILEVADKLGMEVKRTGTHTFSWKEHDSFTLNTRDNYFNWFARSIGGDVIKMVQVVQEELTGEKYTFKQARHFLENQEISVASDTIVSEKELFKYYLEPFETDLRESREYLHNIRGLSNETIDFFIGKEVLAQATKKSEDYFEPVIVFKSLDKHNEVIGASLQGIIENHSLYDRGRLKQIMRGSDGTSGMNVDIGVPNRLIFAESPIDLMSYYELHKDNLQDVRLVAMDGLKESTVSRHVAELLYEVGELNDEVEQAKKSSFLAETAKLSTFFKDGNHQDLITLAIDNDDAGHAFIEKLTAKKIDLTADLPSKMEGIEKMDWNDILKSQRKEKERSLANEQETPYNSEQNKKNETKLRDLSEQAQGAAPLPEVIESQPLKDLSPSQTESHSSLYFTIKNPQKSIYKQNYHPIKPEELNKLNHHTDIIQNAAQWYLDNLSDTTIHYFYLQDNKQYNINIDFKQYHFMHLTGLFPIKAEQTAIKTLHDFAEGRGEYDNILVSNKGATFQKIKVLPHLKSILETESFLFHQVDDIPKLNSLSMTQAIQSDAKNILLAFSYNNENIYPASLMKLSDEFRIQIKNSLYQNVILGIFQEKDGEIHKISINNNYIKDNGAQMLSILKENKRDVSQGAIQTTNTFENNTVKYDEAGIEKMAWNDYLKMSEEKALDTSQGQIKKIENVVGDFSENSQKAAPLPEANKSQPLNGSSPNQTQSQSSLHFTILDEEKSIYKPNYHPINANELRKLNRYAPQLQQTAIWYLNTVADSKVSYFFKEEDEIKMVSVFFKKENFMHLTGIAPVKENQSSEKSLLDFVEGKGEFDHIMIANRGAAFKKLQVLSDFEAVIEASSFYFDNLYQIEKFNRINLSQAIIAKDKSLLLALRDIDGVGVPTSVMKVSKNMSYELEGNEKIILGVFRERKGHIDKLSINEEYVKDGGEELLSILKNEEAKKIAEATKEEATRDTDGDRKSNHEEHSFGSRPIDNNHLKEKPLNRSQEIVSDSEQQKIERTYQYKGYLQSEAEGSTSPVLETSTFERSVTSRPTLSSQHLNFTIKGGFKSTKTSIDHSIDEYDLNKLNRRGHDIQKAAQFYRDNLANSKINYFTSDGNIVTVNFLEKNFMHLTGLKIVNKRTPPEQILYDFAKGGELSYEDIRLSNNDFFLDKIKILTDLEVVTKASSFYFSQLQDIPRYQGRFDGLIKADDKDIMILFRSTEENGLLPVSVFKTRRILTKELEQANKKIILGVFRERDGHFDKLSINEEYVKDGGEEMLSILKEKKQKEASQDIIRSINTFENNTVKYEGIGMEKEAIFLEKIERIHKEDEVKKLTEANKEEFIRDTDGDGIPDAVERNQGTNPYSPDTDGDGKSDHEEISFGSNPIDSNHPQKEQVKSLSEIIDMKNPKELYNVLKDGIKDYFESDTYKEYLTAMSKFHRYSPRNIELILKQNPKATLVASHTKWLDDFGRKVNEGEKPLQILAPVPIKKRDPITNQPILDKDGNVEIIKKYKTVPVFDISQTSGRELPKPVYELKGTFKDYAMLYKSMKEVSEKNRVPIRFEDIGTGSGGYYSRQNNEIVIQTGMSEKQTLKTIIHEMAHSELHSIEKILDNPLSRSERELQAESVAFVVSNHYGIDTSEYTFGYLASWTEDKEGLKDIEEQMNVIQEESEILIAKIDSVLEKNKTKGITKNAFEEKINRLKSEKVVQSEERSQSPKKELSSDKEANL